MAAYGYNPNHRPPSPSVTPAPGRNNATIAASQARRATYQPPANPDYALPGGGQAQASVPNLDALYAQLLASIKGQPLPQRLPPQYDPSALYGSAWGQMSGMFNQLGGLQDQLKGMYNPGQFAAGEQALLDEARRREQPTSVLLYGYTGVGS